MANYMEQVAQILGIEMGEKYDVIFPEVCNTCHATVIFTDKGVNTISTNVYDVYNFKAYVLTNLLTGAYGLKRKPWKPKHEECYFSVDINGYVHPKKWDGGWIVDMSEAVAQISNYKLGNCYRTREEAEANRDKWIAFYKSEEVLEV